MIGSIERTGMIAGLLAAPLIVASHPPETAVRIAGAVMLCGAALAGACLIGESGAERSGIGKPDGATRPLSDVGGSITRAADPGLRHSCEPVATLPGRPPPAPDTRG
jgi:hypothetical protein